MPARRLPYLRRTGGRTAEGTGLLNRGQAMETKDLGAAHALGMGQAPHTAAIELAEVDAGIIDWATEVKETGESDLLIKIAPGLRTIADDLERQATEGLADVLRVG